MLHAFESKKPIGYYICMGRAKAHHGFIIGQIMRSTREKKLTEALEYSTLRTQ